MAIISFGCQSTKPNINKTTQTCPPTVITSMPRYILRRKKNQPQYKTPPYLTSDNLPQPCPGRGRGFNAIRGGEEAQESNQLLFRGFASPAAPPTVASTRSGGVLPPLRRIPNQGNFSPSPQSSFLLSPLPHPSSHSEDVRSLLPLPLSLALHA